MKGYCSAVKIANFIYLIACLFFPLFWWPMPSVFSELEYNAIGVGFSLMLWPWVILHSRIGSRLFVVLSVGAMIWLGVYLLAFFVHRNVETFVPHLYNVVFLFSLSAWGVWTAVLLKSDEKLVVRRALSVLSFSFVIMLFLYVGPSSIVEIFKSVISLDVERVGHLVRINLGKHHYLNGKALVNVSAVTNVVGQHLLSFGGLVLFMVLVSRKKGWVDYVSVVVFSVSFCLSVTLLSGQSMLQLIVIVSSSLAYLIRNRILYGFSISFSFVGLLLLIAYLGRETPFMTAMIDRLKSGNVSTGRVDRVIYFFNNIEYSVTGSGKPMLDPHNLLLSLVWDVGLVGGVGCLVMFVILLGAGFYLLKASCVNEKLFVVLSLAAILNILIVCAIGGGYGYPGLSGMMHLAVLFYSLEMTIRDTGFVVER
ncbi:hypothetical protein MLD52_17585 [Puniceicoccaceae bacterium K14]|nr:hypothetical protein [Puniceicoccaceae bacterium K14]